VRIVSLLPSATESLFALGLGSSLVAVTHECDYPPEAASLPIVTRSTLRLEDKDGAGIETAVSLAAMEGRSLYFVDTEAIRDLEPDLVVAQDICHARSRPTRLSRTWPGSRSSASTHTRWKTCSATLRVWPRLAAPTRRR
jgi:ABC-type Fe3+-hydroxamate transport system substrate-binding protein